MRHYNNPTNSEETKPMTKQMMKPFKRVDQLKLDASDICIQIIQYQFIQYSPYNMIFHQKYQKQESICQAMQNRYYLQQHKKEPFTSNAADWQDNKFLKTRNDNVYLNGIQFSLKEQKFYEQ